MTLLLSACAGLGPPESAVPAWEPLPPHTLGRTLAAQQRVQARLGGHRRVFDAAVEVNRQGLQVVLLTPLGQRVASLRYNGRVLRFEKGAAAPDSFPPAMMLEAMQMIYWPAAVLNGRAGAGGWRIEEQRRRRVVFYAERAVAELRYSTDEPWQGRVEMVNYPHGYSLTVDSAILSPGQ